jgi:hypothetical protein
MFIFITNIYTNIFKCIHAYISIHKYIYIYIYTYIYLYTYIHSDWDIVLCGASPHPSMHIEAWLHNTPNGDLPSKIRKPLLLLPAGNDPDAYRKGGDIYEVHLCVCVFICIYIYVYMSVYICICIYIYIYIYICIRI